MNLHVECRKHFFLNLSSKPMDIQYVPIVGIYCHGAQMSRRIMYSYPVRDMRFCKVAPNVNKTDELT
jgi:hypothetical protein